MNGSGWIPVRTRKVVARRVAWAPLHFPPSISLASKTRVTDGTSFSLIRPAPLSRPLVLALKFPRARGRRLGREGKSAGFFSFLRINSLSLTLVSPAFVCVSLSLFRAPNMPCSEADLASSPSKRPKVSGCEAPGEKLRFSKLSENASAPSRGSSRAAGYDLYSAYDIEIPASGKGVVKTDIQIALPSGCYGRVAPRSGLAANHFIDVGAGVIDEDYRGNVGVVLFNFGKEPFKVKKGDRIAQLICERIYYPELEEVQVLDETERGSGGFGSTGQK